MKTVYDLYQPSGKLVEEGLSWEDAESIADVWLFDEGIELEIVEEELDEETPEQFNEWLRSGVY